jgi:hypothetical protein
VSGYGLDDRAIGVRSPARAKDFSSSPLCPPWGPPNLLPNWYRGSFPGGKIAAGGGDADHSPLSSAGVVNE